MLEKKHEFMKRALAAGYDWKQVKNYMCRYDVPEVTRAEWLTFRKQAAQK